MRKAEHSVHCAALKREARGAASQGERGRPIGARKMREASTVGGAGHQLACGTWLPGRRGAGVPRLLLLLAPKLTRCVCVGGGAGGRGRHGRIGAGSKRGAPYLDMHKRPARALTGGL
eukprot:197792-Chlamydomonas_euryale.AAC.2